MSKKIIWEKYDLEPDDGLGPNEKESTEVEEEEESEIEAEDEGFMIQEMFAIPMMPGMQPEIKTIFGSFTEDDPLSPVNMFECWVGHTNFPITQREFLILDEIEGLGVLRVLTKYRFVIGVEKSFSFKDVRRDIQDALCEYKE